MRRKIGYIGFGALGRQVSMYLREATSTDALEEYLFDDILVKSGNVNVFPFDSHLNDEHSSMEFYVCLGYQHLAEKFKILSDLEKRKRCIGSFIHRTSYVHPSATIEDGVIIFPGCVVDQNVVLKKGVLLNNSVTISHDTSVGCCSFLSPGVVTSGNVEIEEQVFLGSGTIVANGVRIGAEARTGIGAVITHDVPQQTDMLGNPAKARHNRLKIK